MNFLQYAIWGSWLISLGAYLGGGLDFSGLQIGSFFATMGIASLFMPAVMGIIADRWIPAQKLLGICHFISGAFLIAAASQTAYAPLYSCMLLSVMFYMPTIALSNSVAYNALDLARLDTVKHFPPIRVWGTVGFIAAMWFVDLTHIGRADQAHRVAALCFGPAVVRTGGLLVLAAGVSRRAQRAEAVVGRYAGPAGLRALQGEADGHFLRLLDAAGRRFADHQRLRRQLHSEFRLDAPVCRFGHREALGDPALAVADVRNALHSADSFLPPAFRH